ncbi:FAD-dependent oxidoreductase [Rhodococcus artemisiae]|uniref:ferredoxin--NADP(+) reductase n=1 Tax=Rhodococcus artemisiae TaxID=714159 RepID=A0ABU7LAF7_9NOCA|nr:FAD-dependent oxidoreductase [Rhodococcus artemisiae]MEE2058510.1 FAD-dependent oxidoreductase [Rhodococcus artemisiae]
MPYVITQSCCNDASCVSVCPANCIHPTPMEPEFLTAEMLYIDPDTCIDCGACADECPVGAAIDIDLLEARQGRYEQINADYYSDHDVLGGLLQHVRQPKLDGELSVAVVGAGPAAFYAAAELSKHRTVRIDMFDRLPTPYGLVRAGVAPDHLSTKQVQDGFAATAAGGSFEYFLGAEVGTDITHDELAQRYTAVLYASGASHDRRLGVPGEDLAGSIPATEFVDWYNGHPDRADRDFDLSCERVVVVGNGNVALDVARILCLGPDELHATDIGEHAIETLQRSRVREVVVLGRRGVAQAAYTLSEFMALAELKDVDIVIDPDDLVLDDATARAEADGTLDSVLRMKISLAREFASRDLTGASRRIVFRYLSAPAELVGDDAVAGVRCARNEYVTGGGGTVTSTDDDLVLDAGLVIRAIGYRGVPIPGLPFDETRAIVPNSAGRVERSPGEPERGVYVAGWIKRGATGGIGVNRWCGEETARTIVADFAEGLLPDPVAARTDIPDLLAARGVRRVDCDGWNRIDAAELAAGRERGRPRLKLVRREDLYATAGGAGIQVPL